MSVVEITAYKTVDGRIYASFQEAQEAQAEIDMMIDLKNLIESSDYREEVQGIILEFLKENHQEVYELLNNYKF